MTSLLVLPRRVKSVTILLMFNSARSLSGSPCCPITPFQVALSMPTCALKSFKRTRHSDEVAFPNATSTSSRKASSCDSLLGAYTCKIQRYTEIAPAALALEDKPFLPLAPSQRHTQLCWGSQVSQHQLEQTLLHQHLSRKFPPTVQLDSSRTPTLS